MDYTKKYLSPYYVVYCSWRSFAFNVQLAWEANLLIYQQRDKFILVYINEWDAMGDRTIVTNYELNEHESNLIWRFIEGCKNNSDRN